MTRLRLRRAGSYPAGDPTSNRTTRSLFRPLALAAALLAGGAHAQEAPPAISVYGYVRAETILDSRQVADVREGHFLLYPLPDSDANEEPNLLFTAIQTRIGVRAGGAEALGAAASANIEADFFGATNSGISEFRLRNAFLKLDWGTHEVLAGQYWSPLFTVPVYPGTVSFNTGAPFQPFARQPQLRLVLKPGNLRVVGVLGGQRDAFAEIGGPKLQQQSALPVAHLHVRYEGAGAVFGVGGYAKAVRPLLTEDRFYTGAVQAYAKLIQPTFYVAAKATYGGDLTDHLMTGGFVATPDGDGLGYEPLNVVAGWVDVGTSGRPLTFGLFGGLLTNLGASDDFAVATDTGGGAVLAAVRAPTLEVLWRAAPRVTYASGPARVAAEVEVTSSAWAPTVDASYAPAGDADNATNVRGLLAFYYLF